LPGPVGNRARRGWGHISRQRSGRYQASYIGPDLVRHYAPKTFTARMDAEYWIADERRLIERGQWVSPEKREAEIVAQHITLAEYAKTWIKERNVKPRTRIGYESLWDNHIHTLGKVALVHLTPESIRTWYAGLGTDHVRRNSQAYGLLHAILATAVSDQLIPANPANLQRAMNPPTKRQPVILDISEVTTLADTIKPERMRALVLVLAWTGLRWGEAIELERRDVAEGAKAIRVSRAVTHRDGCRRDTPKSGKGRSVIVPPHIRADLLAHLDKHVGKDPTAQLFPAARGCHLNDRVFRDYLAPALKAIGRDDVRIHDLRHFAGTQAARVGNLPETMARLGHSTPKASLIYQGIASGRAEEVAAALSKLAGHKPSEEPPKSK
jgi:integrase